MKLDEIYDNNMEINESYLNMPMPVKWIRWLEGISHKKKYDIATKIFNELLNDKDRNLTPHEAFSKTAQIVGISPKELQQHNNLIKDY